MDNRANRSTQFLTELLHASAGYTSNEIEALEYAIAVLEHSNAPQCSECYGFTSDKMTTVDDRLICDDCVQVWQDEASYEAES